MLEAVQAGAGKRERPVRLERRGVSFVQLCTLWTRCQTHFAVATAAAATAPADVLSFLTLAQNCAPVACRRRRAVSQTMCSTHLPEEQTVADAVYTHNEVAMLPAIQSSIRALQFANHGVQKKSSNVRANMRTAVSSYESTKVTPSKAQKRRSQQRRPNKWTVE